MKDRTLAKSFFITSKNSVRVLKPNVIKEHTERNLVTLIKYFIKKENFVI